MDDKLFSQELESWLKSRRPKTLAGLTNTFAEKSFAIAFLILMAIPALPLPTGGVTHVFELINMLLALELIAGRKEVWLPKKWRTQKLEHVLEKKTLPFLVSKIRWLEKYSRPRLHWLLDSRLMRSFIGIVVLVFTVFAFFAPPFSGLDTLPALGVVLIALSIILKDFAVLIGGLIIGVIGIGLVLALGSALFHEFKVLF